MAAFFGASGLHMAECFQQAPVIEPFYPFWGGECPPPKDLRPTSDLDGSAFGHGVAFPDSRAFAQEKRSIAMPD
jgi:hypothetical protein